MQKHHIIIGSAERAEIGKYPRQNKYSEQSKKRLRILLDLDESSGNRQHTTMRISKRNKTCEATIHVVCKRYEQGGWEAVDWRFTSDDARIKLRYLYPKV